MAPPNDLAVGYSVDMREMYIDVFEMKERKTGDNGFTKFLRSPAAAIVYLVNDNNRACGKRFPNQMALKLAKLGYGDGTTWEDVKEKYKMEIDSSTNPELIEVQPIGREYVGLQE
jgi:hypothetical protein